MLGHRRLCGGIRLLTGPREAKWSGKDEAAPEELSYEREERGCRVDGR
jgi:hypothetical protein